MKLFASLGALLAAFAATAASTDPASVVERWSDYSASPKIIDINFSDTSWPDSWQGETGRDCPLFADGGYVNAIIDVPANGGDAVKYPVVFHNCTFATNASHNGFGGTTAAFARQYYIGEKPSGNSASTYNNWTVAGHTEYLEDNITRGADGVPTHGEAGFVQMCRDGSADGKTSMHGWMEIDHIPYVDRVQWSWSSTSWGRGIKCDVKIGDGPWKPLVWMGSERQKQGWTVFSDQGYFMENVIGAADVSLRWRVWDGEDLANPVQVDGEGNCPFTVAVNPLGQMQAPRVHKIKIYGSEITADQASYARENMVNDPGELSDLSQFGGGGTADPAPDDNAEVVTFVVAQDGSVDFAKIQDAVDAVPDGARALVYIRPGIYEENLYAGRKGEKERFISLIGEDRETVVLTSAVGRGNDNTKTFNDCAALNVYSPRFYAENLTIRNTAGEGAGQAEALFTGADAHVFNNCRISGYQDTYKSNVGSRGYFRDCVIEGTVDFIYDAGLEWFDNCEIRARKASKGGYITAPGGSPMPMSRVMYPELSQPYFYPGLFFSNCLLTAEEGVPASSFTLGRPWQEKSGAMFLDCVLGTHIAPAGWTAWGGAENSSSLYEYRSKNPDGTAADISRRAAFSRQASDAEVGAYMNPAFLFGSYSKVPFDFEKILKTPAAPSGFHLTDSRFTWEADADAAAYLVICEGIPVFTTENAFDGFDPSKSYMVKAVSRYGVTSAAAEVKEAVRLTAFPTAEGFGKFTSGGRGGRVVTVTSLADDGSEGTLRWAFDQYKNEPLTIVFAVSGQIALTRELRVSRADWTLAGQTAPGEGIAITRNKVNLGGSSNFIVRNTRFRIGQKSVAGDIMAENALGAENCSNFIFDHCSFGWSVEENMNTADSHFLTVQYSIVHEGLFRAGHSKGDRGYGCQWGGSPATYHHNLLAHNQSRSCRFNGARGEDHVVFIEYINNVNFNYGGAGACYGGENTAPISNYNGLNSAHECNFINNYYRRGPASDGSKAVFVNSSYARSGAKSWAPAKWFVSGNVATASAAATADNWKGMTAETYKLDDIKAAERIIPQNPYYKYGVAGNQGVYDPSFFMLTGFQSAEDAFNTVVDKAGTINRDKVEARVANDARTGKVTYGGTAKGKTSGIIDTEADAEGFFSYSTDYEVPADTDGDGIPDEWERSNGLDPLTADGNRRNADGYTALEVYLNSLMGEEMDRVFGENALPTVSIASEVSYNSATRVLTIPDAAVGGTLSVYAADGSLLHAARLAAPEQTLPALPAGPALLRVDSPRTAPAVLKVIL